MIASLPQTSQGSSTALALPRAAAGAVGRLAGRAVEWWRTYRDRQALASLNDVMLRDIGLTRADVERELVQPFWLPVDYRALEEQRGRAARRYRKRRVTP